MEKHIFKSRVKAKASEVIQTGQVLTAVTKISSFSNVSRKDAENSAYKKAKQIAKINLQNQVNFINKVIDKTKMQKIEMTTKPYFMMAGTSPFTSTTNPQFNGYTPSQLRTAYNVPSVSTTGSARKVTITIIIAFHYPGLQKNFDTFCKSNNLPSSTLKVVSLDPSFNTNPGNPGWAMEECLDVQWSYAMNPNANIQVVEAKSTSLIDLLTAVYYANNPPTGSSLQTSDIISMSWGSNEFGTNQQLCDSAFFSSPSICYLAATGDANTVSYPAISPNVLSCGGTSLYTNSLNTRQSETTWAMGGCGYSTVYSRPSYQNNIINQLNRSIPDLSAIANPSTGVRVVYNNQTYIVGGTSLSTPVIAGMLSIAIQQRLNAGKSSITTAYSQPPTIPSQTNVPPPTNLLQTCLYNNIYGNSNKSVYTSNFYDIPAGGMDGMYSSNVGFDIPTGLGVPNCTAFASSILNF